MARELALHAAALRPRARTRSLSTSLRVCRGEEGAAGEARISGEGEGEPHPIWCEVLSHHDWSMAWHGPLLGLEIEVRSGLFMLLACT